MSTHASTWIMAATLMTGSLSLTARAGDCRPAGQTSPTAACGAAVCCDAQANAMDRSSWPKVVIQAEPYPQGKKCPLQFTSNLPKRADGLPSDSQTVDQQLQQALSGAQAENGSGQNLTALWAQPLAFAVDLGMAPLKVTARLLDLKVKHRRSSPTVVQSPTPDTMPCTQPACR